MMIRKYLPVMLILTGLLAACGGQSAAPAAAPTAIPATGVGVEVEGGAYTNVTPQQLAAMLKQKDFFFVNVHTPYEGEIEPTDAQIPYDQTTQQLSQYPADKQAKIVLYCRSGRMSAIAAKELVKAGYTNVWNLDGGMAAWETQGLPLKGQ
jgi:rhodanese-related sulfurtransferase